LKRKKIWILDGVNLDHSQEIAIYEANDIDYLISTNESIDEDFEKFGKYADILVVEASITIDVNFINKLPLCKGIISFGTGYDQIDLEAASKNNIVVCHLNYCYEEVADHTLALTLALLRQLPTYHKNLTLGQWHSISPKPIHRFKHITVGLLGFGQIARNVAKRLQAFGFKVIAHDRYVTQNLFQMYNVTSVTLDELLQQSNVLSLHVPLTNETSHLLNESNMRKLPKQAIIINTCRGGIIDEDALVRLINEKHIQGAGIDVFQSEPPDLTHKLFSMDEIIVTPHAAYYSLEAIEDMQRQAAESAIKIIKGEQPYFPVT